MRGITDDGAERGQSAPWHAPIVAGRDHLGGADPSTVAEVAAAQQSLVSTFPYLEEPNTGLPGRSVTIFAGDTQPISNYRHDMDEMNWQAPDLVSSPSVATPPLNPFIGDPEYVEL